MIAIAWGILLLWMKLPRAARVSCRLQVYTQRHLPSRSSGRNRHCWRALYAL